jgi:hypothetical protein
MQYLTINLKFTIATKKNVYDKNKNFEIIVFFEKLLIIKTDLYVYNMHLL